MGSPRAKANGYADGLRGNKCNTSQYHLSWMQTTEYLAGYMEGMDARYAGARFPDEE